MPHSSRRRRRRRRRSRSRRRRSSERREAIRRGLVRPTTSSERALAKSGRESRAESRKGAVVRLSAGVGSTIIRKKGRGRSSIAYIQTPTGQLVEIPEEQVAGYQQQIKELKQKISVRGERVKARRESIISMARTQDRPLTRSELRTIAGGGALGFKRADKKAFQEYQKKYLGVKYATAILKKQEDKTKARKLMGDITRNLPSNRLFDKVESGQPLSVSEKSALKRFGKAFAKEFYNPKQIATSIGIGALARMVVPGGKILTALQVTSKTVKALRKAYKVAKASKKYGKIVKATTKVLPYVPVSAYGIQTAVTVAKTPEGKRAEVLGKILGGEIIPSAVGFAGAGGLARKTYLRAGFYEKLHKLPKAKQELFKKLFKKIQKVEAQTTPTPNNINLQGMGRISTNAQKPMLDFMRQIKARAVLGGSLAQRSQMRGFGKKYWTNRMKDSDLDFYARPGENPIELAKKLEATLKKNGVERVTRMRGTKVHIKGKKVAEFLKWDKIRTNIEEAQGVFRSIRAGLSKTPQGITILKLGMQGRRKLIASYLDKGRFSKDYPDFKKIVKSLYKDLAKSEGKAIFFKKTRKKAVAKERKKIEKALEFMSLKKVKEKKVKVKKAKVKVKKKVKKTPPKKKKTKKVYKSYDYKKAPKLKSYPYAKLKLPKTTPYKKPKPPKKTPPYKRRKKRKTTPPYRTPPKPPKTPPYRTPPKPPKTPPYRTPPYQPITPPTRTPPYIPPPKPPKTPPPRKAPPLIFIPKKKVAKPLKRKKKAKPLKQKVKYTATMIRAKKKRVDIKYFTGTELR